jgi:hypothetical protein
LLPQSQIAEYLSEGAKQAIPHHRMILLYDIAIQQDEQPFTRKVAFSTQRGFLATSPGKFLYMRGF